MTMSYWEGTIVFKAVVCPGDDVKLDPVCLQSEAFFDLSAKSQHAEF